jgi:hypothetical protein
MGEAAFLGGFRAFGVSLRTQLAKVRKCIGLFTEGSYGNDGSLSFGAIECEILRAVSTVSRACRRHLASCLSRPRQGHPKRINTSCNARRDLVQKRSFFGTIHISLLP